MNVEVIERCEKHRVPGFRRLQVIAGAQEFGDDSARRVLPLIAIGAMSASPFVVSLLSVGPMLASVVGGLFAGNVADHYAVRRTMFWANALRFVLTASLAIVFVVSTGSLLWLVLAALLLALADAFYSSAHQVFVNRAVAEGEMTWFASRLMTVQTLCGFAAPVVGGVLLGTLGEAAAISGIAAAYCVSAALALLLPAGFDQGPVAAEGDCNSRKTSTASAASQDTRRHPFSLWMSARTDGVRLILEDARLRAWAVSGGILNCASMTGTTLIGLYAIAELGLATEHVTILGAAGLTGALLASLLAPPLASLFSGGTVRVVGTLVAGVGATCVPLFASSWGLWAFGIADFLWSLGVGLAMLAFAGVLREFAPSSSIGQVGAAFGVLVMSAMAVSGLTAGALASWGVEIKSLLWVKPALAIGSAMVVLWSPLRAWSDSPSHH